MERDEVSLGDYIQVISKRIWTVIIVLLVVVAVTAIITVSLPRVYRATATIQNGCIPTLRMVEKDVVRDCYQIITEYREYPLLSDTEIEEFIKKSEILDSLISQLKLATGVEELKKSIQVRNIKGTDLLRIQVEYPQKGIPQKIGDRLVKEYISLGEELLKGRIKLVYEQWEENKQLIEETKKNLQKVKEALSKIPASSPPSSYQIGIEAVLLNSLSSLQRELRELRKERDILQTRINGIKKFELVDKVHELSSPIRPKMKLNLAASALAGLILGLILAFFREFLQRRRES